MVASALLDERNGNRCDAKESAGADVAGDTAGAPVPIARERETHGGPRVVSNGNGYLVVFASGKKVYATRMDPQSGAYLDDPRLQLADNLAGLTAVASLGSDYLVVWVVNMNGVLGRAIVHADGTVTTLPTYKIPTTLSVLIENVQVAGNGTYYLLAWRTSIFLQGIRLMPDGSTQVDADPINFDTTLTNMSTAFTVLGDTTPAPDRKSFLLFYEPASDAVVRRFRSESGAVISPLTTVATGVVGQTLMTAATDGTRFLATWVLDNANETLHAAFVDPVSGTLVAGSETSVMDVGSSRRLGRSWYDGVGGWLGAGGGAGGASGDAASFGGTGGQVADPDARSGDSGASLDGGSAQTAAKSSGCSCSTGGKGRSGGLGAPIGLALFLLVRRRRSRVSRA
jgi:MYXO-CTERM domain-containing protein